MRKLKQNYIITQTKKEVRLMCYKFWRLRVQRNKYGLIIVIIIITKVLIIAIRSINCKIICIVNDKHDKKLSHLYLTGPHICISFINILPDLLLIITNKKGYQNLFLPLGQFTIFFVLSCQASNKDWGWRKVTLLW